LFGAIRVTQAVLSRTCGNAGRPHPDDEFRLRVRNAPTQGAYSASKHAIEAVANALRYELYPYGIETILIEPGYIVTKSNKRRWSWRNPNQEEFQSGPYAKIYATYWSNATSTRAQSKTTPEDCARIMLEAIEAPAQRRVIGVTPLATFAKWAKRFALRSSRRPHDPRKNTASRAGLRDRA